LGRTVRRKRRGVGGLRDRKEAAQEAASSMLFSVTCSREQGRGLVLCTAAAVGGADV
jgi:hypothetical protein